MIDRRQFIKQIGIGALALRVRGGSLLMRPDEAPQVSITLDDFDIYDTPLLTGAARNQSILDALHAHSDLKAGAFVAGKFIDKEKSMELLKQWDAAGHTIGNHTYSHWYYPNVELRKFTDDIERNELLLKELKSFRLLFRFPFLKEGNTPEQRDAMRDYLKEHGYRNGYVTVDASDWYIDGRLRTRLKNDPKADITPYREFYLSHIWDRAIYYDGLAQRLLGRSIRHTLLLHHNLLNGLFLGDLLTMFTEKGWKLIDVDDAYSDPVFTSAPKIAPAGESLLWALAKESGKLDELLRYPAEDGEYEKPKMDALGL